MNIAIPFKNHFELNDKVQEFNIFFDPNKNSLDGLIDFIQTYNNHIINIEYRNGIDIKTATALSKISPTIQFRLRAEDITKIDKLKERGCKFFFDKTMSANSWSMLIWLITKCKVSNIYICDDLVYEFDKVKNFCDKYNVKIRMIINRAPSSYPIDKESNIFPMYMPQDMEILKQWIDVIEFDCGSPYNYKTFKVLYKVYIQKQFWYGQLGEINNDFKDFDLPCPCISNVLAEKRSTCGLKCIKNNSKCNSCNLFINLALTLRNNNIQLAK